MGEQTLQQISKILTLVESEVVQLKPKLNSAKSHPIDFQLIPFIHLSLIHCQDFREARVCTVQLLVVWGGGGGRAEACS